LSILSAAAVWWRSLRSVIDSLVAKPRLNALAGVIS